MAGPQRPLQTLPESRLLGVKAHPEPINVFVCGAQDVGKTALIVRYCTDYCVTDYDPHQDTWNRRRTLHKTPFLFLFDEVPASCVFEGHAPTEMLQRADALLFAYDVGDWASFETMKAVCEKVLASAGAGEGAGEGGGADVPVAIVATKADTPAGAWQVEAGEGREFAGRLGGVFGVCSAKEGEGVVDAVEGCVMGVVEGKVRLVREREERFRERVETYGGRAGGSGKAVRVVGKVER